VALEEVVPSYLLSGNGQVDGRRGYRIRWCLYCSSMLLVLDHGVSASEQGRWDRDMVITMFREEALTAADLIPT
jgi:hypothetical protein